MDIGNPVKMKTIKVLNDYFVELFADTATGVCGSIWHVAPAANGAGKRTPVGYFQCAQIQPSECRPCHWELQMFLRSDIRYNVRQQWTEVDIEGRTTSNSPHYHQLLPRTAAEVLAQSTCCKEPIAVTVSVFNNVETLELGSTWIDDD